MYFICKEPCIFENYYLEFMSFKNNAARYPDLRRVSRFLGTLKPSAQNHYAGRQKLDFFKYINSLNIFLVLLVNLLKLSAI